MAFALVEAYENKHYRFDLPDPIEAIKFRMEQKGMTPKDLVPMIGRINRVYEVLSRKRPLTLAMIQRLHRNLVHSSIWRWGFLATKPRSGAVRHFATTRLGPVI